MVAYTSPLAIPYPTSSDTLKDVLVTILPAMASQVDDVIAALSAVAAVGWTDLTLGSGWTNVSLAEKTQYARAANSVTVALAALKTTISAGDVLATLPTGFRPSRPIRVIGQINQTPRYFQIQTNGEITSEVSTTAGVVGTVTFPL